MVRRPAESDSPGSLFWVPPLWNWIRTSGDRALGSSKVPGDWNLITGQHSPYPKCWITKCQRRRRRRCSCSEVRKRNDSVSNGIGIPDPGEGRGLLHVYPSIRLCHSTHKRTWVWVWLHGCLQKPVLRDLGSHTESPMPSMRSGVKSTVVGASQEPTYSVSAQYMGDQHVVEVLCIRKQNSDEDNHSLETSCLGLE